MSKTRKRFKDSIDVDDYWMAIAFMFSASSMSNRPQACVVVSVDGELLVVSNDAIVSGNHIVSAEMNSILNCKSSISDSIVYLTYSPSYNSVLVLIKKNVKRIVYFPTKSLDSDTLDVVRLANVNIKEFKGNLNWMRDYLKTLDIF